MDTALSLATLLFAMVIGVWQRHVLAELRRIRREIERLGGR